MTEGHMINQRLNLLKGISCLIVIFLHCRFPGVLGDGIIYGLRFSVPVFFMVSGYYSYGRPDAWVAGHMRKLLKLTVCFELLHGCVLFLIQCVIEGKAAAQFFGELAAVRHPLRTLFFGVVFNGSLWYLYAMFWTWGVILLLRKTKRIDKSFLLIPLLLALNIFGRYYWQNHFDIDSSVYLFRSCLLFGLPFTLLGLLIAEHEEGLRRRLSARRCIGLAACGHVLIVAEFLLSGQYMDLHVSTVVIAAGLFLHAVLKPELSRFKWLSCLGQRYSMWIYLIHFPVIAVAGAVGRHAAIDQTAVFGWLRPVAVCLCSVALAAAAEGIKGRLENSNNCVRNIAKN